MYKLRVAHRIRMFCFGLIDLQQTYVQEADRNSVGIQHELCVEL